MCKLAYIKTKDGSAYRKGIKMIEHQESVVAGHSTSLTYRDSSTGKIVIRKAVGKVINYMAEFPDIPASNSTLSHSRWASLGVINIDNQHPIAVRYKGKVIGQVIHNGTWRKYQEYEYMRVPNTKNKTDSAIMVAIFSDILEKKGNTPISRKRAFATMKGIIDKGTQYQNFIFMFNDGMILFGGEILTYKETPKTIGVMTFGLPEKVEPQKVYEIRDFKVIVSDFMPYTDYTLTPRPVVAPTPLNYGCGGLQSTLPPISTLVQRERDMQTTLGDFRVIEGQKYTLQRVFLMKETAKIYGERVKKNSGWNYRILDEFKDGKVRLYVQKTKKRGKR